MRLSFNVAQVGAAVGVLRQLGSRASASVHVAIVRACCHVDDVELARAAIDQIDLEAAPPQCIADVYGAMIRAHGRRADLPSALGVFEEGCDWIRVGRPEPDDDPRAETRRNSPRRVDGAWERAERALYRSIVHVAASAPRGLILASELLEHLAQTRGVALTDGCHYTQRVCMIS